MDKGEINKGSGWVRLYRKVLESPLIRDARLLQVTVYCLLKANHKQKKILWNGQEITLKPGQFITGRTQANADLGLKSVMFDRKLKVLQNIGFLNREGNNRFSIITINNWEEYQGGREKMNSQMNNRRTTDEQQMNIDKNDKNGKNEQETTTAKTDVAVAISQIFRGRVKTDKIRDQIQGRDPDEVIALARYCQHESKATNPAGLFFFILKEGTKPPLPATKTRPYIPPPTGGYQTGEGPLIVNDQVNKDDGAQKTVAEDKGEEEESEEEFLARMERDKEKLKKECKSSPLGDTLYKQLERLRLKDGRSKT